MNKKRIKVICSPDSTKLAESKGISGANALCGCKDVCLASPPMSHEE